MSRKFKIISAFYFSMQLVMSCGPSTVSVTSESAHDEKVFSLPFHDFAFPKDKLLALSDNDALGMVSELSNIEGLKVLVFNKTKCEGDEDLSGFTKAQDDDARRYYQNGFNECGLFVSGKKQIPNIARPFFGTDLIFLEQKTNRLAVLHEASHFFIASIARKSKFSTFDEIFTLELKREYLKRAGSFKAALNLAKIDPNNIALTIDFLENYVKLAPIHLDYLVEYSGEEIEVTFNFHKFAEELELTNYEKLYNLAYLEKNYHELEVLKSFFSKDLVERVEALAAIKAEKNESLEGLKEYRNAWAKYLEKVEPVLTALEPFVAKIDEVLERSR